jgi:hypothetical protein
MLQVVARIEPLSFIRLRRKSIEIAADATPGI